MGSDSKNGVRHQRALSPRLSMMMMMMIGKEGPAAVASLHLLVLVTELFCQVAVDIIDLLSPCKDSGNRFILTVLNLCTHFS